MGTLSLQASACWDSFVVSGFRQFKFKYVWLVKTSYAYILYSYHEHTARSAILCGKWSHVHNDQRLMCSIQNMSYSIPYKGKGRVPHAIMLLYKSSPASLWTWLRTNQGVRRHPSPPTNLPNSFARNLFPLGSRSCSTFGLFWLNSGPSLSWTRTIECSHWNCNSHEQLNWLSCK